MKYFKTGDGKTIYIRKVICDDKEKKYTTTYFETSTNGTVWNITDYDIALEHWEKAIEIKTKETNNKPNLRRVEYVIPSEPEYLKGYFHNWCDLQSDKPKGIIEKEDGRLTIVQYDHFGFVK